MKYGHVIGKRINYMFYFRTHTIILLDHDDKIEYNEWTMINENWEHQCFTTTLKYET